MTANIGMSLDMDDALRLLQRLHKNAENLPTVQIAERVEQLVRNTFRIEETPWGAPWDPWSDEEALLARRRKNNITSGGMLFATGALFSEITREHTLTTVTLTAGTGVSEPYADVQQFGNANIPARAFFPLTSEDRAELPDTWANEVVAMLDAGLVKGART